MSAIPNLRKEPAPDEFEVLPPEGKDRPGGAAGPGGIRQQMFSHFIAYLMDNVIKLPGTKRGIGLNPILDIVPVLGDGASALIQMLTIMEGARRGVPKIVLARMGLNILLSGAANALPVLGEVFAWWFRPSTRNYNLLVKHAPQTGGSAPAIKRKASTGDYLFVYGLIAVLLTIMGMFIFVGFLVLKTLWNTAFPGWY